MYFDKNKTKMIIDDRSYILKSQKRQKQSLLLKKNHVKFINYADKPRVPERLYIFKNNGLHTNTLG